MAQTRIGLRVQRLRAARGLSQATLARKAGTSQQYISLIEAGERKSPGIKMVQRLAKALGVPVTALLE